mgnify:CR=1 FL=1
MNYVIYKKAEKYLNSVLDGKFEPRYVIKQCEHIKDLFENSNTEYHFNEHKVKQLENILKLLKMPTGSKTGCSVLESLAGFQCLILLVVWCTYSRDTDKRRYENVLIELPRKTGKTMLIAILFIVALLTEPLFSRLFSVAPDGTLSREVYTLIQQFIQICPQLQKYKNKSLFKITRDKLTCYATHSEYIPLNYSTSRLDGRMPSIWLSDETSALPSEYPISAMRLGSLPVKNKLGIMISTKYTKIDTPFEDEIVYFKSVLDDNITDNTAFCMLFEPDETYKTKWDTDLNIIKHVNPLAKEQQSVFEEIKKLHTRAIEVPSQRSQFLCKMLNIISNEGDDGAYVPPEKVDMCEVSDPINWVGRDVYIGIDLSQSGDNSCVSMLSRDEHGKLLCMPMCFIPKDKIAIKSKEEKCDYKRYIDDGLCIACGSDVIGYDVIENYILSLENTYGVNIVAVGYDRYNCISTVNKLETGGLCCVEVKQHSSVLHRPTKLLYEEIMNTNFNFNNNLLFKVNFLNCICDRDTNLNRYVHKKKSRGKIDMVVATLNALYLLQENEDDNANWVVQC